MRVSWTIALLFTFIPFLSVGQAGLLDQKVELKLSNVSLEGVLKHIEKNYDLHFSYNPDLLPSEKNINIQVKNKSLAKVLESVFKERGLRVLEKNAQLVVVPIIPELDLLPPNASSEKTAAALEIVEPEFYEISGMVLHRLSRRPLKRVRVIESQSLRSTKTGSNGSYQLQLTNKPDTLYLRFSLDNFMEERLVLAYSIDHYHSVTLVPQPKKLDFVPTSSFDEGTQTASVEKTCLLGLLFQKKYVKPPETTASYSSPASK